MFRDLHELLFSPYSWTLTSGIIPYLVAASSTPSVGRVQEPRNLSTTELDTKNAKWLKLDIIDWEDQEGVRRKWEVASRKTTGSGGVDAVEIIALLRSQTKDEPISTIIIEQYRPPTKRISIGLIDADESAESAALRELEEETGFKAEEVMECTPIQWSDPGMTTVTMKTAFLSVPVSSVHAPLPKQRLEEGEHVVRRIVPIEELKSILAEYSKQGAAIDSRLSHFAEGWDLARRLG
ncbi:hypothetical protein DL93DRAFT_2161432 [Clavulina sp. PMI_390]|nr:hypothetical protein DL93DRAFT_2161432 [Clavulina sp. PMI_390]